MRKFPDADLIRYFAPGNHELVVVNSPRAFREVTFTHAYAFAKPKFLKRMVGDMTGRGLFFAEGDVHRSQKKLLAGISSLSIHFKTFFLLIAFIVELVTDNWQAPF